MKTLLKILVIGFVLLMGAPQFERHTTFAQTKSKRTQRKVATYACPMHPEVKSNSPGKCPKCGMTLRAVKNQSNPTVSAPVTDEAKVISGEPNDAEFIRVPDATVSDQNGKQLKFYTNLVKGKTVAVNFIFTTCTTVCPPLTATFRRVQQELAERVRGDVNLISISVDPTTDTPERLKEFAAKFKAGPGWTFVTGDKTAIDGLLQAFGTAVASKNDHTAMILIGNDGQNYWTRTYGLASPTALARLISDVADRKKVP